MCAAGAAALEWEAATCSPSVPHRMNSLRHADEADLVLSPILAASCVARLLRRRCAWQNPGSATTIYPRPNPTPLPAPAPTGTIPSALLLERMSSTWPAAPATARLGTTGSRPSASCPRRQERTPASDACLPRAFRAGRRRRPGHAGVVSRVLRHERLSHGRRGDRVARAP